MAIRETQRAYRRNVPEQCSGAELSVSVQHMCSTISINFLVLIPHKSFTLVLSCADVCYYHSAVSSVQKKDLVRPHRSPIDKGLDHDSAYRGFAALCLEFLLALQELILETIEHVIPCRDEFICLPTNVPAMVSSQFHGTIGHSLLDSSRRKTEQQRVQVIVDFGQVRNRSPLQEPQKPVTNECDDQENQGELRC